ncbi:MAG: hypothetical protein IT429_04095 [Gemmataceae bacterium]|nr:hypothetical protein [Gemmataceae bacterium]
MIECRYCGELFYADPERVGARCRRCREPLYERRDAAQVAHEPVPAGARCATHPNNPAAGTCQRCGTYICGICRSKWQDRALCLACLTRALDSRETRPEEVRAHQRQALLALVFGATAWGLTLASALLVILRAGADGTSTLGVAGLLVFAGLLPALFGIGQGAAAIRARGNRMIVATLGFVLSAVHVGAVGGLMALVLWQQAN